MKYNQKEDECMKMCLSKNKYTLYIFIHGRDFDLVPKVLFTKKFFATLADCRAKNELEDSQI